MKRRFSPRQVAFGGVLAALYAAVTLLTASFAYGPVQFRIAEALAVFCCFEPTAVYGITLGCLISNLFSPVTPMDAVVGTVCTLLAALRMTKLHNPWRAIAPNVLYNAVGIGAELALVSAPAALFPRSFALYALQIALGELAVMLALGVPLWYALQKSRWCEKLHL